MVCKMCYPFCTLIFQNIPHILYTHTIVLLVPNSISKIQKWRVQFGNIRNSFLSKHEALQKLKESQINIQDNILPNRTKFSHHLCDLLYDESYAIQVTDLNIYIHK